MLDEKGFKRKRFSDWWIEIEAKARSVFGEQVNLTERTPLGIILRLIAWVLALLSQLAENVYNSAYVDTAVGVSLDRVGKRIGIKRHKTNFAKGAILVTGTPGKVIQTGFRIRTITGIVFETTEQAVIGDEGTVSIPIRAVVIGSTGNVPANSITVIVNPDPTGEIQSITNPQKTDGGRERESDTEFRERYDQSLSLGGSSTTDSIRAKLLQLTGVRDCIVDENDSTETVNELPPKCVAPIVFGGDDQEIAATIMKSKAAGIKSWGETVVNVMDSKGIAHPIGFSRPETVTVYVNVALITNSNFPANGVNQVRTRIIQHIGGTDENEVIYAGLGLEENVVHSQLISAIYLVPGIDDVSVTLGTSPDQLTETNIIIGRRAVAETDWQKVVVS